MLWVTPRNALQMFRPVPACADRAPKSRPSSREGQATRGRHHTWSLGGAFLAQRSRGPAVEPVRSQSYRRSLRSRDDDGECGRDAPLRRQRTGVVGVRRGEKPAIKATARPSGPSAGRRRPAPGGSNKATTRQSNAGRVDEFRTAARCVVGVSGTRMESATGLGGIGEGVSTGRAGAANRNVRMLLQPNRDR
jgi:hypothetical protein